MATINSEILKWSDIAPSGEFQYTGTANWDTGEVLATVTATAVGPNSYNAIATDGSASINTSEFDQNSQFYMTGDDGTSPRNTLSVSFQDDASSVGDYGVNDLSFVLNDIDAGSSSSYQDEIIIRATSADGSPLTLSATAGANFDVFTEPDGSLRLVAKSGTNSVDSAESFSKITIAGGPIASFSVEFGSTRNEQVANNIQISDIKYSTVLICFTDGTQILTKNGSVPVEDLKAGDMIWTRDNGYQPLLWSGKTSLRAGRVAACPELHPVRIKAGALGAGLPTQDLIVSQQHRVLIRSKIAKRMFGEDEVLVAAKHLLMLDGIDTIIPEDTLNYHHLLLKNHEVILSSGAETESLFTGPQALLALGPRALSEIRAIMPDIMTKKPQSARPLATGRMGRKLAERHAKNSRPLSTRLIDHPIKVAA